MRFKVFTPVGVLLNQEVSSVDFQAIDGFWTILPRHVDMVSALRPCVVQYKDAEGQKNYIACNKGVLIKQGHTVSLSTNLAILNDSLETLTKTIKINYKEMEEERKEMNVVLSQLELGLTKGLLKLKGVIHD